MMETPEQNRNVFAIKKFLSEYLDLRKDKDNELETVDSIRKGVEFKGANLWILIFAIFMASLGLNVNSTAVIIGAMLISPYYKSQQILLSVQISSLRALDKNRVIGS